MRILGSYFHVYALAAFTLGFAIVVAQDPEAFVERIRPAALEGAVFLDQIGSEVRDLRSKVIDDDTVETLTNTLQFPGVLLKQVEKAVSEVRKELARPTEFEPPEDAAASSAPEQADI